MKSTAGNTSLALVLAITLAGCSTGPGIYAPPGGDRDREVDDAPAPPAVEEEDERRDRLSEQPQEERERETRRDYQEQGDDLSPAAANLIDKAETLMAQGNPEAALSQLERAQRISPRSAQVYFRLSEAYVETGNLGAAEQFTLKGLSLAGSNAALQKNGWQLLADIRRERGNVAGAEQAERRAADL